VKFNAGEKGTIANIKGSLFARPCGLYPARRVEAGRYKPEK